MVLAAAEHSGGHVYVVVKPAEERGHVAGLELVGFWTVGQSSLPQACCAGANKAANARARVLWHCGKTALTCHSHTPCLPAHRHSRRPACGREG